MLDLLACFHAADHAVLGELGVGLRAPLGVGGLRLERGKSALGGERVAVCGGFEIDQIGLGLGELTLGVERLQHHVGVRELHEDRAHLDRRAGAQRNALDAAGGVGGDEADALGDQRAGSLDLAEHGAALDRVGPEGRALDHGSGGAQAREGERDQQHRGQDRPGDNQVAPARVARLAGNVDHAGARLWAGGFELHRGL